MVEPVSSEEFMTRPERRRPEEFQFIKLREDGGVARMTLDRPEHNLLNETMLRELADGTLGKATLASRVRLPGYTNTKP